MNFLKKTFVFIFICALLFQPQLSLAAIELEPYPDPKEVLNKILERFGINKEELKKTTQSTINVATYKVAAPQVTLTFVPESPAPGRELTAMAVPSYFIGEMKSMYYTWYLRHADCPKAKLGDEDYNSNCDLNEDKKVDIEDWKIEAMKIMATEKYDDSLFPPTYNGSADADDDGFGPLADFVQNGVITDEICETLGLAESKCKLGLDKNGKNVEEDINEVCRDAKKTPISVCTKTPFGGANIQSPEDGFRCYVSDFESGVSYEIVEPLNNKACPEVHRHKEENISDLNTAPCDTTPLGENICNTDASGSPLTASQNGGWISMEAPNLPLNYTNEPGNIWSWGRIWIAYVFNGEWRIAKSDLLSESGGPGKNSSDIYICDPDGPIPEDWVWGGCNEEKGVNCYWPPVGEKIYLGLTDASCTIGTSTNTKGKYVCDPATESANNRRTDFVELKWNWTGTPDAKKRPSVCTHLFPHAKDFVTGDKKFTDAEEKFWGTNPNDPDTANSGTVDEALLAGVGKNTFRWNYQAGDEIGVAVEGISTESTKHADSSYKVMWALPNNVFNKDSDNDDCEIKNKGSYSKTIQDIPVRVDTAYIDISACLEKNFVNPTQGSTDKKIEANLSYLPKYPINDPFSNNSDDLVVKANLANIENKSLTNYNWTVSSCTGVAGSNCTPLTPGELGPKGLQRTKGIGLDSLKLKLAFPATVKSLKFVVTATEDTQEASGKIGKQEIVVPLQTTSDIITPGRINLIEDMETEADVIIQQSLAENRYSNSDLSLACPGNICPVVKNEIIGLHADIPAGAESRWYLDGKPLMTGTDKNQVFFPVLQGAGYKYVIKLDTANDTEKISLTREFKVEDPKVDILPQDCSAENPAANCAPLKIGETFNPLDHTQLIPSYSESIFQAKKNVTVIFKPFFNFDASIFEKDDGTWKYNWYIDGIKAEPENIDENGNLKLSINKEVGEKHKITLEALYTQTTLAKRALGNIWSVPDSAFYETTISDSAEILVVAPNLIDKTTIEKILPSLFSNLPEYLSFLFRVFVTIALIMLLANLSLVLLPRRS